MLTPRLGRWGDHLRCTTFTYSTTNRHMTMGLGELCLQSEHKQNVSCWSTAGHRFGLNVLRQEYRNKVLPYPAAKALRLLG